VITGNFNRGAYYADDLREVREEGVEHVMRLFFRHATEGSSEPTTEAAPPKKAKRRSDPIAAMAKATALVCEEELLDA
jgi:hypothetical protein